MTLILPPGDVPLGIPAGLVNLFRWRPDPTYFKLNHYPLRDSVYCRTSMAHNKGLDSQRAEPYTYRKEPSEAQNCVLTPFPNNIQRMHTTETWSRSQRIRRMTCMASERLFFLDGTSHSSCVMDSCGCTWPSRSRWQVASRETTLGLRVSADVFLLRNRYVASSAGHKSQKAVF